MGIFKKYEDSLWMNLLFGGLMVGFVILLFIGIYKLEKSNTAHQQQFKQKLDLQRQTRRKVICVLGNLTVYEAINNDGWKLDRKSDGWTIEPNIENPPSVEIEGSGVECVIVANQGME